MTTRDITDRLETMLRRTTASLLKTKQALDAERAAARGADRDRLDGVSLPRGTDTPERLGAAAEGRDVIGGFPRAGTRRPLRPRPRCGGQELRAPGRLPRWRRAVRRAASSASRRARRRRWIRSSACCSRSPGRRSSAPGSSRRSLRGSATGVFVGPWTPDYGADGSTRSRTLDGYSAPASTASVASGRLAYTLGLRGPGDDGRHRVLLVAGGAAPRVCRRCGRASATWRSPAACTVMTHARPRSSSSAGCARCRRDGRCKAFSAAADGAGWAEGCGMLVLKRLSDAQRDGDPVLARDPRHGRQPGRAQPRPDRAERSGAGAGDPPGARERAACVPATSTSSRRTARAPRWAIRSRPARCWRCSGRRDRPSGRCGWARRSRTSATRRRRRASPGVIKMVLALQHEQPAEDAARGQSRRPHIEWEGSGLALLHEARAWQRDVARAAGRRELVRHQRHQRPRDARGGARR